MIQIPWKREWLPIPVFLPGEFLGLKSLAGYSLWSHKQSITTEQLSLHFTSEQIHWINLSPHLSWLLF